MESDSEESIDTQQNRDQDSFQAGAHARKNDIPLEDTIVAKMIQGTEEYDAFMAGYDSEVSDACPYKVEFLLAKELLELARKDKTIEARAKFVAFFFKYNLVKKIELSPQYVNLSEKDMRENLQQQDGSLVVGEVVAMSLNDPELHDAMKSQLGDVAFQQWLRTYNITKDFAPHLMPL